MTRRAVQVSAAIIASMVLLLLIDWGLAAYRAAKDEKLVKDIQEKVKNDAALAPKLAAEQKRMTDYRKARKQRDKWAGNILIVAAVVFLVLARRGQPRRVPRLPQRPGSSVAEAAVQHRRRPAVHDPDARVDLSFVDEVVAKIGRGREMAIPLLQAIQTHYRYLPDDALRRLCELTEISPAQIAGTSSFYGQFRRSPVGEHIVKVCHGTACHVAGARQVTDELRRYLEIPEGQDTDPSRQFTVEEVACVGCCSLAPVLMVDDHTAGRLKANSASEVLKPFEKEPA